MKSPPNWHIRAMTFKMVLVVPAHDAGSIQFLKIRASTWWLTAAAALPQDLDLFPSSLMVTPSFITPDAGDLVLSSVRQRHTHGTHTNTQANIHNIK